MSYELIEAAVVARMIEHFSELDADRCKAGELDAIIHNLFETGERYGCILEYFGAGRASSERFNHEVWRWDIGGIIMIRYDAETIESDLRTIIDKLKTVFSGSYRRLGGADLVTLVEMDQPDVAEINEVRFYWLPFLVSAIED
jgi:hypothetical protein